MLGGEDQNKHEIELGGLRAGLQRPGPDCHPVLADRWQINRFNALQRRYELVQQRRLAKFAVLA